MSPPTELQELALNFPATFFSRHLSEQQLSCICMSPLRSPFYSLILPYANLYGLSVLIRPFQGPLYTAMGPFFPVPPGRGFGGGLRRLRERHTDIQTDAMEHLTTPHSSSYSGKRKGKGKRIFV